MKKTISVIIILLLVFISSCINSPERGRAVEAVEKFMNNKNSLYQSGYFGEFFEQNYPDLIQKEIGTNEKIKYSIVHTYYIDEEKVTDEYFHLDKNFKVVGHLSKDKMVKLTSDLMLSSPVFKEFIDSLNNVSADSLNK